MKTNHKMPYGRYKGQNLDDIPPHYLLWWKITKDNKSERLSGAETGIYAYINDNYEHIKSKIK